MNVTVFEVARAKKGYRSLVAVARAAKMPKHRLYHARLGDYMPCAAEREAVAAVLGVAVDRLWPRAKGQP